MGVMVLDVEAALVVPRLDVEAALVVHRLDVEAALVVPRLDVEATLVVPRLDKPSLSIIGGQTATGTAPYFISKAAISRVRTISSGEHCCMMKVEC